MIFRQFFDYESWTYTYLLGDEVSGEAVLIDSVKEQLERDLRFLQELNLKLKFCLETHIHADHVTGAYDLREKTGAKVGVSAVAKASGVDLVLKDGDTLSFGPYQIKCFATPGHTNSCMSFYCEDRVFTGDTLFVRDVGRTDFQEGSPEAMYKSITEKLFSLPDETLVYPAHDYKGQSVSTIGEEKDWNLKLGGKKTYAEFKALVDAMKLGLPKKIHIAVPANLNGGKSSSAL